MLATVEGAVIQPPLFTVSTVERRSYETAIGTSNRDRGTVADVRVLCMRCPHSVIALSLTKQL